MGTRRRESDSRLLLRITKALEDRDTLIPCQACGGSGDHLIEYPKGGYRQVACKWCSKGFTDKETARMFQRWLRIARHNKSKGLC